MSTKVTFSGSLIAKALEQNIKDQIEKALSAITSDAIATILKRTSEGKDMDDSGFPQYTEKYKNRKGGNTIFGRSRKKAKSGGNTQTSPPNLRLTGQMLGAIRDRFKKIAGGWRAEIFILSSQVEKAQAQHFGIRRGGKIKNPRPFFGFGKKLEDSIREKMAGLIDIRKANK